MGNLPNIKLTVTLVAYMMVIVGCGSNDEFRKESIRAVISKKYISFNHAQKVLVYPQKSKSELLYGSEIEIYPSVWGSNDDVWDYAQVGDSIIKPANCLILIIKKPNGAWKYFQENTR